MFHLKCIFPGCDPWLDLLIVNKLEQSIVQRTWASERRIWLPDLLLGHVTGQVTSATGGWYYLPSRVLSGWYKMIYIIYWISTWHMVDVQSEVAFNNLPGWPQVTWTQGSACNWEKAFEFERQERVSDSDNSLSRKENNLQPRNQGDSPILSNQYGVGPSQPERMPEHARTGCWPARRVWGLGVTGQRGGLAEYQPWPKGTFSAVPTAFKLCVKLNLGLLQAQTLVTHGNLEFSLGYSRF